MQIEGEASQIPAATFRAAVEASAALRDIVVRYNDVHLALLQQTAGCNALHDVENRMSRWLLQTHDRCENDIIPLTQEFLSEMLGVQRTSVTAIARALQTEGLIRLPARTHRDRRSRGARKEVLRMLRHSASPL